MLQFNDLLQITKGDILQVSFSGHVQHLIIDSRHAIPSDHSVFFSIRGAHLDGHDYINKLYKMGVKQFVVEKAIDVSLIPNANVFQVENSIKALQDVSSHHRSCFDLPIIGITGSNGKTIVKEWLFQLLSLDYNLVKSPKSYNSQIGVPLSVWLINARHDLGIFEAGISTINEMENLRAIIDPSIGIFTNIGTAHARGFKSIDEKIDEKLKLFDHVEYLIYCRDQELIHKHISRSAINNTTTWGQSKEADIRILDQQVKNSLTSLRLSYKANILNIALPFTDGASIENAMHCITYMLSLGYAEDILNQRICALRSVKMRLELKNGINGCQLIDDTYNNDLGGLKIALEFMNQQNVAQPKTVILSDILQSDLPEDELYQELNKQLRANNIRKFIGIGSQLIKHKKAITVDSEFYPETDRFIKADIWQKFNNETILVKGARPFSFEKIVNRLQQKIHGTSLEINLNALTRNLNFYRSKIERNTKIMVMVKAFAYGSGSHEVAYLLQHHQIDYLGVAYTDEGVSLRQGGIQLPIMVMNPTTESFEKLIMFNLEPEIYSLEILKDLISFANNQEVSIHLKIDTGMRRLGFEEDQVDALITLLKNNRHIIIKSVFTHLAGADESLHNEFSKLQIALFSKIADKIKHKLNITPLLHVLNSAGILRFPNYHFDMVRLGIGLYGVDTNMQHQDQLEPISILKTFISQVKDVKKDETVGYGRKGKALQDMVIATVPIGYADGYSRGFSNGVGSMAINGQLAPVVGNVCMDMTMIDITAINANIGDEVIIFGKQPSIFSLAEQLNTIPYEILTSVSGRVKRVFFQD